MSLCAGSVISVHEGTMSRKYKLYTRNRLWNAKRLHSTVLSAVSYRMCIIIGILCFQAFERRIAAFLHRMADSLSDLSLVTFFQYRLRLKNRVISIFCALFSILIVGVTAFYLLVPPMMYEFVRVKDLLVTTFPTEPTTAMCPKHSLNSSART